IEAADELLTDPERAAWEPFLARKPRAIAAEWLASKRAEGLTRWLGHLKTADPKLAQFHAVLSAAAPAGPPAGATIAGLRAGLANLDKAADLAAAVDELTELARAKNAPKKDWPSDAAYEAVKDAFEAFRKAFKKKLEAFTTPAASADVNEAAS